MSYYIYILGVPNPPCPTVTPVGEEIEKEKEGIESERECVRPGARDCERKKERKQD